jgi:hypothetical protein
VAEHVGLEHLREQSPVLVFDELHKNRKWKNFLKGFFDVYGPRTRVIVTGMECTKPRSGRSWWGARPLSSCV